MPENIAVMVSRHAAFYSPLIASIAAGFLEREGLQATYAVLQPGQRSRHLLASGEVDVMQSAVGSNWGPMEAGETELPVHFAQINTRDGFYLASRQARSDFSWKDLEGSKLLADHGGQPMLMLRYAAREQGVDWSKIEVLDRGGVDEIDRAFRSGEGDFVHQQGPAPQQLEQEGVAHTVASVGEAMPAVAFSSLAATRAFVQSEKGRAFMRAYAQARAWVQTTSAAEIAAAERDYFPQADLSALQAAIERYQRIGTWQGDVAIPPDLYEQALEVFLSGGAITRRHPYAEVVVAPPA